MSTRTASDVKDPHSREKSQFIDEKGHFVFGAHRERIPQIRRAEVIGDAFEPVTFWRFGHVNPLLRPTSHHSKD
jgi:hypothetical protein